MASEFLFLTRSYVSRDPCPEAPGVHTLEEYFQEPSQPGRKCDGLTEPIGNLWLWRPSRNAHVFYDDREFPRMVALDPVGDPEVRIQRGGGFPIGGR